MSRGLAVGCKVELDRCVETHFMFQGTPYLEACLEHGLNLDIQYPDRMKLHPFSELNCIFCNISAVYKECVFADKIVFCLNIRDCG